MYDPSAQVYVNLGIAGSHATDEKEKSATKNIFLYSIRQMLISQVLPNEKEKSATKNVFLYSIRQMLISQVLPLSLIHI